MALKEETIKKNLIYKGKILDLFSDDVKCDNGVITKREIVNHHGGVCILGFVDGKIPLVKQFRYAYQEVLLELPAGKIEENEDPLEAAKREYEEETGNKVLEIKQLGSIYPSCGYTNEIIRLYYASKLESSKTHYDVDENIEIVYKTIDEVIRMIDTGEIKDAKTIALIYHYLRIKK